MELSKETIEKYELSDDAVAEIQGETKSHITELEGTWAGKANEGAQKIIDDVILKTQNKTGFELERNQGEKNADFLIRYSSKYLDTQKTELESSKLEYDNKVKNFKGDQSIINELNEFKSSNKTLKEKEAEWDKIIKSGVQDKLEEQIALNGKLNRSVAYSSVKPIFDKDENKFEVAAKWKEFKDKTSETNNIVMHEDVAYAVDKKNDLIKTKLEDLVKADEELMALVNGRSQEGIGGKQADLTKVDGLSFPIPKDADRASLAKLVQEQLTKDGVSQTDRDYSKKYQDMYDKAKAGQQTVK